MENILAHMGFEPEFMGGGCYLLTRNDEYGACVAVSDADGSSLPDADDWLVCGYPDGEIGSPSFGCSFYSGGGMTLEQAVNAAWAAISPDSDRDEVCRNGKPWAECNCC
jgi:hypothetical protein